MTEPIPDAIDRYLTSADDGDLDTLVACFTEDAVVTDDGVTRHGRAEIRQWRDELASGFEYTVTVLASEPTGADTYLVTTRVAGNFPGSPVDLRYVFTMSGDLISELVIAP
jgi:ketosteroid isomerase-like protein